MSMYLLLAAMSCYGLEPDRQAYCQAMEKQNAGFCYSIKNGDLRAQCRAEVSQGQPACDAIADMQKRQWCKDRSGR